MTHPLLRIPWHYTGDAATLLWVLYAAYGVQGIEYHKTLNNGCFLAVTIYMFMSVLRVAQTKLRLRLFACFRAAPVAIFATLLTLAAIGMDDKVAGDRIGLVMGALSPYCQWPRLLAFHFTDLYALGPGRPLPVDKDTPVVFEDAPQLIDGVDIQKNCVYVVGVVLHQPLNHDPALMYGPMFYRLAYPLNAAGRPDGSKPTVTALGEKSIPVWWMGAPETWDNVTGSDIPDSIAAEILRQRREVPPPDTNYTQVRLRMMDVSTQLVSSQWGVDEERGRRQLVLRLRTTKEHDRETLEALEAAWVFLVCSLSTAFIGQLLDAL